MSRARDPIVETRTVIERVCPAELLAGAVPAKPEPAKGAVLDGNAAGLDFLRALGRWGDDLRLLFADAAAQCS